MAHSHEVEIPGQPRLVKCAKFSRDKKIEKKPIKTRED